MGTLKIILEVNLTLIPANEYKVTIKKYEEIWNKIKYFIKSENNGSGSYDDKYTIIRFNWNDNKPLKKELEMHGIVVIICI